jgi:hypothetical protein
MNLSSINYRRIGYIVAIGTVTAVAARVSYSHIRDVTEVAGQPADVAMVLPLAVDGMLLAASLAMAEDKANFRQPRAWARFGFWFGASISLACNVASTVVHFTAGWLPLAIFIAALAPALLLITVEIMARPGKPQAQEEASPALGRRVKTDDERLEDARRRAGYYQMDAQGKAEWTRKRNEREAKRIARTAPQSPGAPRVTGQIPTEAELEAVTA